MVKYYTADEVAEHNSDDDCWVSVFENVFDMTSLITANRGPLAMPIIEAAGTSISHWFERKSNEVKTFIDPELNIEIPYTPMGRFIHVPPPHPVANLASLDLPWWKDQSMIVGKLTQKTRTIKVVNMLARTDDIVRTCEEETINDIRDRYMEYNKHAGSYTWKALINNDFVNLDMLKTLAENSVPDESEKFFKLGLDDDFDIPTLHIYYDDDLTYA